MSKRVKDSKKFRVAILLVVLGFVVLHVAVVRGTRAVVNDRLLVFGEVSADEKKARQPSPFAPDAAGLTAITPFEELTNDAGGRVTSPFGDDADCWSNMFSQYGAGGLLIFDANGDGLNDVYFSQDGQNWTRPTDDQAVLMDEPRDQHNFLYICRGMDARGAPTYQPVHEFATDEYIQEEMLIEDRLFPRQSKDDTRPVTRKGRSSNLAVAADFDGDGDLDVLVGNEPQGMFWTHEETQRVLARFVSPVGREVRKSKQPLSAFGVALVNYTPTNSLYCTRASARYGGEGREPEGANSLYLNMGDKDGDGAPEWKDASIEACIEGPQPPPGRTAYSRPTYSLSVADIDLDGDLDIYAGNLCDMDYWIGGSRFWAGGANSLYLNQLAESNELRFVEVAAKFNVDGVYDEQNPMPHYYRFRRIPFLPKEYSLLPAFEKIEAYQPDYLKINGEESERGQISWASVFQDVNTDGFPDIWVANDMGYLRLYENQQGTGFVERTHARSNRSGYWMSFAPGDYNGDLHEDLFAGNLGGGVMNHAFATPDVFDLFDPVILNATIFAQFATDKHDTRHALIDGADYTKELKNKAHHSRVLPPDVAIEGNFRTRASSRYAKTTAGEFDPDTVNAYEFAWGIMPLDVQNDGKLDYYYIGCLYGRGGGLLPIAGTNPGRLMVNVTTDPECAELADLTAEHHLFNIEELEYDDERLVISRKAPTQNWRKRDMVYSYDQSSWALHGVGVPQKVIDLNERVVSQDLIHAAEQGRAVVAADLNNDGFQDLVLRNKGGYDSRSSKARNLRARVNGKAVVLPPHNNNYPSPTNFEPGRTRVFLNRYGQQNWVKIRLVNDAPGTRNVHAVGARVVVNDKYLRVRRAGQGGYLSNKHEPLHFGLGDERVQSVKVYWPNRGDLADGDGASTITPLVYELEPTANETLVIRYSEGRPHAS